MGNRQKQMENLDGKINKQTDRYYMIYRWIKSEWRMIEKGLEQK